MKVERNYKKEKSMNELELKKKACEVRRLIVEAVHSASSGHPGGSLCDGSGGGEADDSYAPLSGAVDWRHHPSSRPYCRDEDR